jgi:hypothetical protein
VGVSRRDRSLAEDPQGLAGAGDLETYLSVRGFVGPAEGTGVWLKIPKVWLAMLEILTYFSVRGWVGSADGTGVWLKTPKDLAGDTRDLELTFQLKAGWGRQKERSLTEDPEGSGR